MQKLKYLLQKKLCSFGFHSHKKFIKYKEGEKKDFEKILIRCKDCGKYSVINL